MADQSSRVDLAAAAPTIILEEMAGRGCGAGALMYVR